MKPSHLQTPAPNKPSRCAWIHYIGQEAQIEARELLGELDELKITHDGRTYTLRRTRQNKLMLVA